MQFLTPSTTSEYIAIDSFHFAEEICEQDPNLHTNSLDLDSLFCIGNLYSGNENPPNLPRHDFRHLLNIATKKSFFTFSNKYYKQVDDAAMGSP